MLNLNLQFDSRFQSDDRAQLPVDEDNYMYFSFHQTLLNFVSDRDEHRNVT